MRVIHTADWHLGHSLYAIDRSYEHRQFLKWLLDTLEQQKADAIIIAGDVFDTANPPVTALSVFYAFLADAHRRCPGLEIIIVAGNHDSATRLEAPSPLIQGLRVRVVGTLERHVTGKLDPEKLIVPLHNAHGEIAAWCAAVPFLRSADLPPFEGEGMDPLIEGVRLTYAEVLEATRARMSANQALIATGHCYMVGTQLSELSERRILGGNQHALPVDIFHEDVSYAALGHLHLAQTVGKRNNIRYSGSPIPLAMSEANYQHQVLQLDFYQADCVAVTPLYVPRAVELIRLGERVPLSSEAALQELQKWDWRDLPGDQWPYLEVTVLLDQPDPGLRHRLDEAIAGKPVRLVKLTVNYQGREGGLADSTPLQQLGDLKPEEVFKLRYKQQHMNEPSVELMQAFFELVESVDKGAA